MNLEQDIKWLSNHPQFANFIKTLVDTRESYIGALHDAEPNRIMQISGRVLAYDDVLRMVNAEELIRRHTQ
jgi:hypothetical protein